MASALFPHRGEHPARASAPAAVATTVTTRNLSQPVEGRPCHARGRKQLDRRAMRQGESSRGRQLDTQLVLFSKQLGNPPSCITTDPVAPCHANSLHDETASSFVPISGLAHHRTTTRPKIGAELFA